MFNPSNIPRQVEIGPGIVAVLEVDEIPARGVAEQGLSREQGAGSRGPDVGDRRGDCSPAAGKHHALT